MNIFTPLHFASLRLCFIPPINIVYKGIFKGENHLITLKPSRSKENPMLVSFFRILPLNIDVTISCPKSLSSEFADEWP